MKRAFTQKVESVPSCAADNDALAKLSEGKLPREVADSVKPNSPAEVNRRARTSAAMIGLALSMGASSLLLPQQGDEAMAAAEPIATEPTAKTTASADAAVVSPIGKVEPEVAAVAKQPAVEREVSVESKQPAAEREAKEVTPATARTLENRVNLAPKRWQVSKTSPDAIAASNDLKSSPAVLEGQVPTISPVNSIVHEVNSNKSVDKVSKSYGVESTPVKSSTSAPSVQVPVAEVTTSGNFNDLLKVRQDEALNRLKQQRNRLQSSLAELKSEESTQKSEQAKVPTDVVAPTIQPSTVPDSVLEAQTPIVTQPERVVSVPTPIISPMLSPTVSEPKTATVPSTIIIPVQPPQKPATSAGVIEPKTVTLPNLVSPATQSPRASANPELPTPFVIQPQVAGTGTPARVYQVRPGDTLAAIAQNYGVSPAEMIRLNNIDNPNLIQINQELRIPSVRPATLVPNLSPTASAAKPIPVKSEVIVPQLTIPTLPNPAAQAAQSGKQPAATTATIASTLVGTPVASTPVAPVWVANEPNDQTPSAGSKQVSEDNPYVEKLRGEILKLRQQYQSQKEGRPLNVQVQAIPTAPIPVAVPLTSTKPEVQARPSVERIQARPSAERIQAKVRVQPPSVPISIPVPPPLSDSTASTAINPEFNLNQYNRSVQAERTQVPARRSGQQQLVAAAPGGPNSYNPMIQAPVGEMVAPELPPLQGPNPYLPENQQQFQGYIWPSKGVLTSGYGWRWGRMHKGIDIAAPVGTPVVAAASGVVVSAGWNSGGYGNLVEIQHPDGSLTRYAHNNRVLVRAGQVVEQGQQISEMGSTGFSTGPHCHFEMHAAGQGAVNPIAFLPRR